MDFIWKKSAEFWWNYRNCKWKYSWLRKQHRDGLYIARTRNFFLHTWSLCRRQALCKVLWPTMDCNVLGREFEKSVTSPAARSLKYTLRTHDRRVAVFSCLLITSSLCDVNAFGNWIGRPIGMWLMWLIFFQTLTFCNSRYRQGLFHCLSNNVFIYMDEVEPYVPPTKIPRPKCAGKHKSEMNFQKFSNTYSTIVGIRVAPTMPDFQRWKSGISFQPCIAFCLGSPLVPQFFDILDKHNDRFT
jgi:hypothetical protein